MQLRNVVLVDGVRSGFGRGECIGAGMGISTVIERLD